MGVVVTKTRQLGAGDNPLQGLRAVVLLAGSVRPGPLSTGIGRPVYELPLERGCSILDAWRRQVHQLAATIGLHDLPLRIMIDRAAPEPRLNASNGVQGAPVQIERDPFDFRGTGGVLRDLALGYDDNDRLLVANAAQILLTPLNDLTLDLAATGGDVTIVSHRDGTPSGLLLLRCGALRVVPPEGFIDMKEQALPAIAAHHRVAVLEMNTPSALPIRFLSDYIRALRWHHHRSLGCTDENNPYAEDWEPAFAIAEDGALVHPQARLHDSVVLAGGRVEANAVVAHSIVCPGGVVRRGQMCIDTLLASGSNGRRKD
jgi:mannose-1-phosphate guanylyltransferase